MTILNKALIRERLIQSAPACVEYVYIERMETKPGLKVFSCEKHSGWKVYELPYDYIQKPEELWKNKDLYYIGSGDYLLTQFCGQAKYVEGIIESQGWEKEYLNAFCKFCGKDPEKDYAFTVPMEKQEKRGVFAYYFLLDKLGIPEIKERSGVYKIYEPDPRE